MALLAAIDRFHPSKNHRQLIGDNPWMLPPATVVEKGRASLNKFYDDWKRHRVLEEIRSIKVVTTGAAGAGKTRQVHLVASSGNEAQH